jgi:hypothetical protein
MRPATTLQRCLGASLAIIGGLALTAFARSWHVLRDYPHLLLNHFAEPMAYLFGISVINLTCWLYLVCRFLLLKETGRKLLHFEKQLATGETSADELARRFQQQ